MSEKKFTYAEIIEIVYNEIERQRNKHYLFSDQEYGNKMACDNIENRIHTILHRLKKQKKMKLKKQKGEL